MDLKLLEKVNKIIPKINRVKEVLKTIEYKDTKETYLKFRFVSPYGSTEEYDSTEILKNVDPLLIRSMILEDLKAQLSELEEEFENL